ncbi:hypothetical protein GD3902_16935 [Geobacillus thermodenitrificans]|nr:hypothetical protein GD3902_16935 [Geobacillus thermodenitrificans]
MLGRSDEFGEQKFTTKWFMNIPRAVMEKKSTKDGAMRKPAILCKSRDLVQSLLRKTTREIKMMIGEKAFDTEWSLMSRWLECYLNDFPYGQAVQLGFDSQENNRSEVAVRHFA